MQGDVLDITMLDNLNRVANMIVILNKQNTMLIYIFLWGKKCILK